MQMPIDSIWHNTTITGVPVTLTAMNQAGNYIDIGTVTTEGYYGTFGLSWTPTAEGTYRIIATFEGDESYGSSGAATYVTVGPAASASGPIEPENPETPETPETLETPEPEPTETPLITTEVAIIAAVVIASIIGVVSFFALKKRK